MTMSNVHILHPAVIPLAAFLRVGHTGHQKLEALHASDRLPYRRIVFDAAHVRRQGDLLRLLKRVGCEIVLDLNFAETAASGRFSSAVSKLPWGNPERPWEPADFGPGRNSDLIRLMAEFALETGADAVLAPTHATGGGGNSWHTVDMASCTRLRSELDRAGGSRIAIDFQLITTMRVLKDPQQLGPVTEGIADLPIQNIWLRASGFGATATGAGTRHIIEIARGLHALGRPLVIDMAGGFAGLATLAFGASGGISHGVAQKESFDLANWKNPPSRKGGGTGQRVYVSDLDRYLTEEQSKTFFAARGTKSRFGCTDTTCCRHGVDDMLENGHAHFITQRAKQIEEIDHVPEGRRAEQFLLRQLDPAVRSARHAANLKFPDEGVQKLVEDSKTRLVRFRDALGALHDADTEISFSRAPIFRAASGGTASFSAVLGTQP
jgi:hypothetical protein